MPTRILIERVSHRVGSGARQRTAYRHAGLLSLYHTDVRSRNDFICAPEVESFSIKQAQHIGRQMQHGVTSGELAGGLRWVKAAQQG